MNQICLFNTSNRKRVVFEITSKCPLNCSHCCSDSSINSSEQPSANIKHLLQILRKQKIEEIYITGGEPFIRNDISEILNFCSQIGYKKIKIATNGTIHLNNVIKVLKDTNTSLLVSLDGACPETHDSIRGTKGSFAKTLRTIKLLIENNIDTRICFTISEKNYTEITHIISLAEKMNVKKINFNWMIPVGRASSNKSTITFDKYIYFSELLKKLKKRHEGRINIGFHRFEKSINCREDCPGGDKILFVNSNLEISPCSWIDKITKEYTSPIKSTNPISQRNIIEFRKQLKKREKKFGFGCPVFAYIHSKDLWKKDPCVN